MEQRTTTQQPSLIQKDIKRHTNYGENYNRQSFYDTIDECLDCGEYLYVDDSKPFDEDIIYLRCKQSTQAMQNVEFFNRLKNEQLLREELEKDKLLNR